MKTLKLKDIIFIAILSVVFGIVYLGAVYAAKFIEPFLIPIGLGAFKYEVFYGIWFMAAAMTTYIIRKPGVGVIAELMAAVIEVLMGNMFGPIVIVTGLVQGLGCELPFFLTKYKRFDAKIMYASAISVTVFSVIYTMIRGHFAALSIGIIIAQIVVRLISALIFTGFINKQIADKMNEAGVLSAYPISEDLQ